MALQFSLVGKLARMVSLKISPEYGMLGGSVEHTRTHTHTHAHTQVLYGHRLVCVSTYPQSQWSKISYVHAKLEEERQGGVFPVTMDTEAGVVLSLAGGVGRHARVSPSMLCSGLRDEEGSTFQLQL